MTQIPPTLRQPDDLRGAIYMVVGAVSFAVSFAIVKDLTFTVTQPVIILFRSAFALCCFIPLIVRRGPGFMATANPIGHLWRSALGFVGYNLFVAALTRLPLGDTIAYSFTQPFWAILFGVVLFGERLNWRLCVTIVAGGAGVVLIAGPSGQLGLGVALALGNALFGAMAMVALKRLSASEPPDRISFYFMAFGMLIAGALAPFDWSTPTAWEWLELFGTGVTFYLGQQCLTRAYTYGRISRVSPLDFIRLPISVALGYFWFDEIPELYGIIGMALIAAAAVDLLVVARRSRT